MKSGLRFVVILVLMTSFQLNLAAQDKRLDFQVLGGFVHQIDGSYPNPNQIGVHVGAGIYKEVKIGRFGLEAESIFVQHRNQKNNRNQTYEGISLSGKVNFLVKTFPIGDRYVLIGPGIGIYQPLNKEIGSYDGPSFGGNAKALLPVKISDLPFYITYDFDFITFQGYFRNGIGVSFWPL